MRIGTWTVVAGLGLAIFSTGASATPDTMVSGNVTYHLDEKEGEAKHQHREDRVLTHVGGLADEPQPGPLVDGLDAREEPFEQRADDSGRVAVTEAAPAQHPDDRSPEHHEGDIELEELGASQGHMEAGVSPGEELGRVENGRSGGRDIRPQPPQGSSLGSDLGQLKSSLVEVDLG